MRSILLATLLLVGPISVNAQSITDSLVLLYTFTGNANDASGNGLDGTSTATLTTDRFSNSNEAFGFNGVTSYVDLPSDIRLKPDMPFTVSAWFKMNSIGSGDPLFMTDYNQNIYAGAYITVNGNGTVAAALGNGVSIGAGHKNAKVSNTVVTNGQWYHVVAVFRGINDIDLYLDCTLENGSYNGGATSWAYTAAPGTIGRGDAHISNPPLYFNGDIDEVAIWNRELTANEISSLCSISLSSENLKEQTGISVYPNPMEDFTMVDFGTSDDFSADCMIEVYDAAGKLVLSEQKGSTQTVQLNRSGLEGGIYTIVVSDNEVRTLAGKLIVQ